MSGASVAAPGVTGHGPASGASGARDGGRSGARHRRRHGAPARTGGEAASATRSRDRRWRRRGMMRPTLAGLLVLALGGGCAFLALLLDDRALSAATLAMLTVTVTAWIIAGVQRRMVSAPLAKAVGASSTLPGMREGFIGYVPARGWRRFLLPHCMTVAVRWERLDQHGDVIDRGTGVIPHERGRYRHCAIAATWSDPFGLVRQRRMLDDDGETLMLPAATDEGRGGQALAADTRLQDQSVGEGVSGVREYAPGDSPRMISWRHTAHHGELMTRESDRDVQSMTLIVVDTSADAGADLDAAAADVMRRMRMLQGRGAPIAVGDGTGFHADRLAAVRFLASMRHEPGARADGRPGGDDSGGDLPASASVPAAAPDPAVVASRVTRFVASQHHPITVTLVTAEDGGPLERALRSTLVGSRLTVHAVGRAVPGADPVPAEALPVPDRVAPAASADAATDAASSVVADPWDHPWRRHMRVANIVTLVALTALYVCTLAAINPLMEISGTWWPFLMAGLVAVSAEAVLLPPRSAWRAAAHVLADSLVVLVVAFLLVVLAIHGASGSWPFGSTTSTVVDAAGAETEVTRSNLDLFVSSFERGFDELYSQLPPVRVGVWSNIVLIVLAAALIILMRCLLTQPLALPVVAVLPVTAMGIAFAFVGAVPSFALIGASVLAAFTLLWSVRPVRALAPLPLGASALATALVLALTPSAQSLAIAVPMAVGTPGGLFTTSTVNPLVDLKRGLNSGSNAVVFSYSSASGSPYYFRMATLDDFNGDTWRYDPQLATDGGLYGGHVNLLGRPQSDDTTDAARGRGLQGSMSILGLLDDDSARSASPYVRTIRAAQLLRRYAGTSSSDSSSYGGSPYGDSSYGGSSGLSGSGYGYGYGGYTDRSTSRGTGVGTGDASFSDDDAQRLQIGDVFLTYGMIANTGVTIDTLGTRFLPLPGETLSLVGDISGANGDWYRADDGTVFSTGELTRQDMEYTSVGAYLDPISSDAEFSRLDTIDRLRQKVIAELNARVITPQQREQARRAYAEEGLGTVDGDWLLVPLHLQARTGFSGRGEYVVVDAHGNPVSDDDYPNIDNTATTITLRDDLRHRLGIDEDELYAVAYGRDGTFTLAFRLTGFDRYGDDVSTPGSAPTGTGDDLNGDGSEDMSVPQDVTDRASERSSALFNQAAALFASHGVDISHGQMVTAAGRSPGSAWSSDDAIDELTINELTSAGTGLALRSRYGGLPSQLPEHVQAVIDQARAEGVPTDGASEQSQTEAMRWLVRYFSQPQFVYSLAQPDGNGRNNLEVVDDFLVAHSGYCTHYATALAVLARGLGLSSRVVLGYGDSARLSSSDSGSATRGTDAVGSGTGGASYDVLAKQLHSWTEVYIDGIGWVPFDVTPSVDHTTASDGSDGSTAASATSSASTDSSSASASATATDNASTSASASESSTDDAQDTDAEAGLDTPAADVTAAWPLWVTVTVWSTVAALLCAAAALTPWGIRTRRRTRRMRLVDQAIAVGDDDALNRRAWKAAWSEMLDAARDAGVTWPRSATDVEIADVVEGTTIDPMQAKAGVARIPQDAPERRDVRTIARNAMAVAYGAPDAATEPLDAGVPRLLDALRSRVPRLRRLFPRSLFRR